MARIENRSRFIVTVKNRGDLSKTFPFDATDAVKAYIADLTAQKFKPKASRLNDTYLVRFRAVGHPDMNLTVGSEEEAAELEQRIESERHTEFQGAISQVCSSTTPKAGNTASRT